MTTLTCPHCQKKYTLGVDGIVHGCDVCLAVIRNPIDHTVIEDDFSNLFPEDELTDEDAMTDMEKA